MTEKYDSREDTEKHIKRVREYLMKCSIGLDHKAKRKEYAKKHLAEIMADPVRHEEFLVKQRAYRERKKGM